jgi:cell fate regulator YaaT (PSP1 superfamily)
MGCSSCGTGGCGSAGGCQNSGLCASGSCNKMNSYDWISTMDYDDPSAYEFVEVSFKNGARKEFFKNPNHLITGDQVLVEVNGGGYDIGTISLSGELVRLQMKKKFTQEDRVLYSIIRKANDRDLEKLQNKTHLENESMVLARAIAKSLDLDLKVGDVEYQGDMKKATFFFTSNGRVDFRELVRAYAKEFKVKIEMRQIGSRQESARIGGIGSCGRELCCSTWLSDFKSVNTTVARYQNIAINQTKLSGQCGRLKCCLNYELDSYVDALQHFPTHANTLMTKKGKASLVKTDIFKGLMFYVYEDISMRGVFHPLDKEKVKEIIALNKKGVHPDDLTSFAEVKEEVKEIGFADVTGEIELPNSKKKKKKKGGQRSDNQDGGDQRNQNRPNSNQAQGPNPGQNKPNQPRPQGEQGAKPQNNQGQPRPQNQDRPKPQQPNGEQGAKPQNNQGQPRPQNQDRPKPQQPNGEQGGKPQNNQGQPRPQNQDRPKPQQPNGEQGAKPQNNQGQPKPQNQDRPKSQQPNGEQGAKPQNNQGQPRPQNQDRPKPQQPNGEQGAKAQNNQGQPRPQKQDRPKPQQPNGEQGAGSQNNQGQPRPQNQGQSKPQQPTSEQGAKPQNNQGQPRPQNQDRPKPQQPTGEQGAKPQRDNQGQQGQQNINENASQITQEPRVVQPVTPKDNANPTPQIDAQDKATKFDKKGGGSNKKAKEKYVPKHLQNKDEGDNS